MTLSGAYVGPANPPGLDEFETWRAAPAPIVLDYLDKIRWSDIEYAGWLLEAWTPFVVAGGRLVLSVPMLVSSSDGSFAAGAAGRYDAYFTALSQQLNAFGTSNVIIRMGWEFNGSWFPWSLSSTNADMSAANFVAYWRHLVELFRATGGTDLEFDWTVNNGWSAIPAATAYPGDAYVDYVSVDVFDASWDSNGARITDDQARWDQISNTANGLEYWLGFARSHSKPIAIPEWGLNTDIGPGSNGGGDDPSFIANMHAWMQVCQPAYEMYFNYGGTTLNVDADPHASDEYRRLWGAGSR